MEFTKWNVMDGLTTEDAIIGYLAEAFTDMSDKEYIRHAIAVAIKAINAHGLQLDAPAISNTNKASNADEVPAAIDALAV